MKSFFIGLFVAFALAVGAASSRATTQTIIDLSRTLTLEIADTDAARTLGLGGRTSLAENEGMLFVFDKPDFLAFWMKGMRFPLDIVWLNRDVVIDVATLKPPKSETALPEWHMPLKKADRVLEISAGTAEKLGLRPGVTVLTPR